MLKNTTGIPLSVAVFLANDTYDHKSNPNYISATGLLRPIKSIVLSRSIPQDTDTDIADLVPSRVGTAVHDSIEMAWSDGMRPSSLRALGYPESVINRIVVNPEEGSQHPSDAIFIYMEKRSHRTLGKWVIGGKFDFLMEGQLEDFKTTKTYSWISGSNIPDYVNQGSIYRWLNEDIVTEDTVQINYIFTDWIATKTLADKAYPQLQVIGKKYPLMDVDMTERFIQNILTQIDKYTGLPQDQMPSCTKEELWQNDSVWKYYKDPNKTTRSTKNFDNPGDANSRLTTDGYVGKIVEVPGAVKRCKYCNAASVCLQREQLQADGLLQL